MGFVQTPNGLVSISQAALTTPINLSSRVRAGIDWIFLATSATNPRAIAPSAGGVHNKRQGGILLANTDWHTVGAASIAAAAAESFLSADTDNQVNIALNSNTWAGYSDASNARLFFGIRTMAPARSRSRILRFFVHHFSCKVTCTARLISNTHQVATEDHDVAPAVEGSTVFEVTYNSNDPGDQLLAQCEVTANYGSTPTIRIGAIALADSPETYQLNGP